MRSPFQGPQRIEEVEMFRYRGKVFETRAKAEDYAEDLIGQQIKQELFDNGFTLTDWVKVMKVILNNREQLLDLLDY